MVDLVEPAGWVRILLAPPAEEGEDCPEANPPLAPPADRLLRAFCLQLAILTNHQNGRDAHVRLVSVFGPRVDPLRALGLPLTPTSTEMRMYATIR